MRQVPNYLLIGNGRVARHIGHYLSLLQIPFTTWQRQQSLDQLHQSLQQASHVLVLISDDAIDAFAATYLSSYSGYVIHFSGSLVSERVIGTHPLQSFNPDLYTLEQYQKISFVIDHDAPAFEAVLPGLANQHVRLHKSLKAKYHALCVMSGNFSCILWQKLFTTLANEFNLPPDIAYPYLQQQMQNLISNPATALTGPLVRGDMATIEKNLAALAEDPFKSIYESFVVCYKSMTEGKVL